MKTLFNKYWWYFVTFVSLIIIIFSANVSRATVSRTIFSDNFVVYTATAVDSSSTNSSDSFPMASFVQGSAQIIWAGATNGNTAIFELQGSNDGGTNWNTITGSSVTTDGTGGSQILNFSTIPAAQIRVTVTNSGTIGSTLTPYFIGRK